VKYLNKSENKRATTIKILIIFCVIWLAFQFSIIGGLNYEYQQISESYSVRYNQYLTTHPNDYVNASWDITERFRDIFLGTYGVQGTILPDRSLSATYLPIINPFLDNFFNNQNGYQKMLIVQQKGNCGEFAQSITFLLNDTTHLPTRFISFEGIDHMMPEIEVNNQWWVMDKVFLTPEKPIISSAFSNYIDESIRKNIANMNSSTNENSLLKQHGFNETRIAITSYADYPGNVLNEKALKGVSIEVFTLSNSHDPLVAKGTTDDNGQYATVLNSDKDYWILATYEPIPLFPKLVGLGHISNITSDNLSVNVNVTHYG
jgi:hypothetical protein